MNYQKIFDLCKERNINIKQLSAKINTTYQSLYGTLSKGTLSVKKLEKISEVLQVSPADFFTDQPAPGIVESIRSLKHQNELLSNMLEVMDKRINLMHRELDVRTELNELQKNHMKLLTKQ